MNGVDIMGLRSRAERLTEMLRSRTDGDGQPKPGYASNVARIRAELAELQEQIAEVEANGK